MAGRQAGRGLPRRVPVLLEEGTALYGQEGRGVLLVCRLDPCRGQAVCELDTESHQTVEGVAGLNCLICDIIGLLKGVFILE